jgi:hypothetical protein
LFGDGGFDVFGDIDFGNPEHGVEDDFAEVVIGPIFMEVTAGEADAAAAVLALDGPHHGFGFAFAFLNVGVGAFGVDVWAVADIIAGSGDEEVGDF